MIHAVRLRGASFASVCPDPPDAFAAWWDGIEPTAGTSSALVLFDPIPGIRRSRRRWIGLDAIDRVDPRYRGYAHAIEVLRQAGRA